MGDSRWGKKGTMRIYTCETEDNIFFKSQSQQ